MNTYPKCNARNEGIAGNYSTAASLFSSVRGNYSHLHLPPAKSIVHTPFPFLPVTEVGPPLQSRHPYRREARSPPGLSSSPSSHFIAGEVPSTLAAKIFGRWRTIKDTIRNTGNDSRLLLGIIFIISLGSHSYFICANLRIVSNPDPRSAQNWCEPRP